MNTFLNWRPGPRCYVCLEKLDPSTTLSMCYSCYEERKPLKDAEEEQEKVPAASPIAFSKPPKVLGRKSQVPRRIAFRRRFSG